VLHNETGILIDDIDTHKLVSAIKAVGRNPSQYKEASLARAKEFDTSIFIKRMKEIISS